MNLLIKYIFSKSNSLWVFTCLLLVATSACKKEITSSDASEAIIRYFAGGNKDKINRIEKTADGGFIYCGYTTIDSTYVDGFMMKVDGNGKQQWYRTYGGKYYDEIHHAIQTSDGGFLAVGATNSFGQGAVDTATNLYDYEVKTDANGNVLWSKSQFIRPSALAFVKEIDSGNFVATGYIIYSDANILTVKLGSNGTSLWGWVYNPPAIPPNLADPKNYHDYGNWVSETLDGNLMVAGIMSKSGYVFEVNKMVTYLMKLDKSTGNPIWFYPYYEYTREGFTYHYSWPKPHRKRPIVKVMNVPDGYMVATYFETADGHLTMQLMRTDLNGVKQWSREYPGLGYTILQDIEMNPDGSYLLIGCSSPNKIDVLFPELFANLKTVLMKVSSGGNEIWTQYIGGNTNVNISKCVQARADGGWNVAGFTCDNEGGYDKMFVMQVDKDGKLLLK